MLYDSVEKYCCKTIKVNARKQMKKHLFVPTGGIKSDSLALSFTSKVGALTLIQCTKL